MTSTITPNGSDVRAGQVCRVCGDRASGRHYGVMSCDGCRGFFKRAVRKSMGAELSRCKDREGRQAGRRCLVDATRRTQCQQCRWERCLEEKMNPNAVQKERQPRSSRNNSSCGNRPPLPIELLAAQRLLTPPYGLGHTPVALYYPSAHFPPLPTTSCTFLPPPASHTFPHRLPHTAASLLPGLAPLATAHYGDSSRDLQLAGVTSSRPHGRASTDSGQQADRSRQRDSGHVINKRRRDTVRDADVIEEVVGQRSGKRHHRGDGDRARLVTSPSLTSCAPGPTHVISPADSGNGTLTEVDMTPPDVDLSAGRQRGGRAVGHRHGNLGQEPRATGCERGLRREQREVDVGQSPLLPLRTARHHSSPSSGPIVSLAGNGTVTDDIDVTHDSDGDSHSSSSYISDVTELNLVDSESIRPTTDSRIEIDGDVSSSGRAVEDVTSLCEDSAHTDEDRGDTIVSSVCGAACDRLSPRPGSVEENKASPSSLPHCQDTASPSQPTETTARSPSPTPPTPHRERSDLARGDRTASPPASIGADKLSPPRQPKTCLYTPISPYSPRERAASHFFSLPPFPLTSSSVTSSSQSPGMSLPATYGCYLPAATAGAVPESLLGAYGSLSLPGKLTLPAGLSLPLSPATTSHPLPHPLWPYPCTLPVYPGQGLTPLQAALGLSPQHAALGLPDPGPSGPALQSKVVGERQEVLRRLAWDWVWRLLLQLSLSPIFMSLAPGERRLLLQRAALAMLLWAFLAHRLARDLVWLLSQWAYDVSVSQAIAILNHVQHVLQDADIPPCQLALLQTLTLLHDSDGVSVSEAHKEQLRGLLARRLDDVKQTMRESVTERLMTYHICLGRLLQLDPRLLNLLLDLPNDGDNFLCRAAKGMGIL